MNKTERYTITAALPYANGPLHIGHIAGAYLPADIFVRFLRMTDQDVVFVCGSDEHGAAITLRAKKEGTTPQAIVDKYHKINKKAFEEFGIDFDVFHRTSDPIHHETAGEFFSALHENGEFEEKETEQFYDKEHKQFLADRYVTGECPKCHNPSAYGDQCERCGSSLNPADLINPRSVLSGKSPVLKSTKHFYLPMQKHESWLKSWIEEGKLDNATHHDVAKWRNQVIGQCKSWIDGGLQSRAITRDLDWGVKVPVPGAGNKVLYVWFDAPIGYISATKAWAEQNGTDWKPYWQSNDTKLVHFIGKDNIVFHCIIFPIILKLRGDYILPDNVPANEFLNLEGDKLSTSRNWAVWLHEYLEDFPNRKDELRYVLTSIAPETRDSEFTWGDYQARVNNELVAILGNFVNRSVVLTHKYFEGQVPQANTYSDFDQQTLAGVSEFKEKIETLIGNYKFREAQAEAMNLARLGNKYLADTEPWKLIKENKARVETILNVALQITANLTLAFKPFLPETSTRLEQMLNSRLQWSQFGSDRLLKAGHTINKAELLFTKVEDADIAEQIEKLEKNKNENNMTDSTIEPQKATCTFDDFMKMDIRVGEVLEAEKVKKTDKLLQLKVDTGLDQRTILSGIAEHFSPEEVVGKKVSVLVNLAPRKIRGIESQGMVLMAENNEGRLEFVSPGNLEVGSIIR